MARKLLRPARGNGTGLGDGFSSPASTVSEFTEILLAEQGAEALRVARLRRLGVRPALAATVASHAFGETRA